MRVLVVHNRYRSAEPGGEDRVVDQEVAALCSSGHTVERFERFNDDIDGWSPARKALLPGQVVWNEQSRRSLTRTLGTMRPDVVHVHNTFPLLSPSVLYACRAAGVPVVATLHNYGLVCPSGALFRDRAVCHDCVGRVPFPAVRHGCYKQSALASTPVALGLVVHGRAWRSMVSAYVCISGSQREILVSGGFPPQRMFVKHNFVPPLHTTVGRREDIVVYAGRLTTHKGVGLLMEAWDRTLADNPEGQLRLVIAGKGPLEPAVTSWAAGRPSVDFVGLLDRAACARLLSRARAAVVPSQWEEAFGLIAVEAMSVGVPPVAPGRGSFPELITDGDDGVLFEPGNAAALAEVFRDIESDPERYEGLGRTARATYERRFTPEANVEQLLRIYQFAVAGRSA
ncbi:MAG: glycosyltransferase [Actinomycetota bacterium]|nr:glycosyltransferase [Actinomycetota bacterium]MDQ6945463.1 glycosyltransferase [Actinomycetota bacterium]